MSTIVSHAARPLNLDLHATVRPRLRRIRIGLLGLGQVNQAVVRLAADQCERIRAAGIQLSFECALVRSVERERALPAELRPPLTVDRHAFLAGEYDVVIEALGGVEPAGELLAALLRRGVPVVSANKSVLAARGDALLRAARQGGVWLRDESAAIAGVPFLDALRSRPLLGRAVRLAGLLNGATNFIATALAAGRATYDEAVARAQRRGLLEPDPARDVDGRDAADKLALVVAALGWGVPDPDTIERASIAALTPADIAAAERLGGRIKPLALAAAPDANALAAFVGPVWLPADADLAGIDDERNALRLDVPGHGRLLFAGPGAGPTVTAGTLIDDVIAGVRQGGSAGAARGGAPVIAGEIRTGWFVRFALPAGAAGPDDLLDLLASHRVWTLRCDRLAGDGIALLTTPGPRATLERAVAAVAQATGARAAVYRALTAEDDR